MRKSYFLTNKIMGLLTYSTGTAAADTIDLSESSDTSHYTFDAPRAGKILVNLSFATVLETIGAASGVGSIEVGGTEIATIVTTNGNGVGTAYTLTPASNVGDDGSYPLAAGDAIEFITKTTNGSTGELRVDLVLDIADV